jgi:hypothetical protein
MNLKWAHIKDMSIERKNDEEYFMIFEEDKYKVDNLKLNEPFAPSAGSRAQRSPKHQLAPPYSPFSLIGFPSS